MKKKNTLKYTHKKIAVNKTMDYVYVYILSVLMCVSMHACVCVCGCV